MVPLKDTTISRTQLAINDTGGRFSVLPEWSHSYDAKGILLVTPDYIPGCRMSFSFRSMPEGYSALAYIHSNAEEKEATVCTAGTNHYIFYPERGSLAETGTKAFCWEIAFDNHLIAVFAEVPDAYVKQEVIERLVEDMADVVESAKHA